METIDRIKKIVEKELSCSAHDLDHVMRVYNLCPKLAEGLKVDYEVLNVSSLLHDIARVREDNDPTGKIDHAYLGAEMSIPILYSINLSKEKISHVYDCILSHRYRSGNEPKTIEAKILFDADKLDSLGAIGIARSYVWVGRNNAKIHRVVDLDPYIVENLGGMLKGRIQDKTKHSPQMEFLTKLGKVYEKLYTEKARQIGKERTDYYKSFLDRLDREIIGEI